MKYLIIIISLIVLATSGCAADNRTPTQKRYDKLNAEVEHIQVYQNKKALCQGSGGVIIVTRPGPNRHFDTFRCSR